MRSEDTLNEMLAYLRGELPATEQAQIEEKRAKNELYDLALRSLKANLEEGVNTRENIHQWGELFSQSIREAPDKISDPFEYLSSDKEEAEQPLNHRKDFPIKTISYFLAAAAVVFILAIVIRDNFFPKLQSPQEIAQSYILAEPYEESLTTLSATMLDCPVPEECSALELYNQGTQEGYKKALPLIEQMISKSTDMGYREKIELQLCLLYIYLYQNNQDKAFELVESLQEARASPFHDEILWFSSLAFLKYDQTKIAIDILRNLEQTGGIRYKEKAQKLIERLI